MVVLWFIHLAVGAGAGYAIFRIWPERGIPFVRFTLIHLLACVLDALMAVTLLLLAKDVHLTWKFAIALFAFGLARDCVRLPLILYILRPPATPLLTTPRPPANLETP